MSAGEEFPNADSAAAPPAASKRDEMRTAARYIVRRGIWFRARGVLPAPGTLLNISERGALAQFDAARAPPTVGSWPLHLRHGDELWLTHVIKDPLACWVVAVERDLIRLRLFSDTDVLSDLRALIANFTSEQGAGRGPTADQALGELLAANSPAS